jgi:thiol-disulfide isomerase/thioredoxin
MRLAPAALSLAILAAGCATPHHASTPPASPALGRPADLTGHDLAGRQVRIADDVGRVRVVDFWATWCEPCREQLPVLERLHCELGPRGLSVYGVATDEERRDVEAFLVHTPVSFPVLLDPAGEALARPLAIDRLPTTLLVDRKGIVREVHLGYESADAAWLEARVVELLAE